MELLANWEGGSWGEISSDRVKYQAEEGTIVFWKGGHRSPTHALEVWREGHLWILRWKGKVPKLNAHDPCASAKADSCGCSGCKSQTSPRPPVYGFGVLMAGRCVCVKQASWLSQITRLQQLKGGRAEAAVGVSLPSLLEAKALTGSWDNICRYMQCQTSSCNVHEALSFDDLCCVL